MLNFLFRASLLLLGLLLALAIAARLLLTSLAFHPTREAGATPEDAGLRYEDVTLTAADGVRLHAWYVPAENARATLLFCHGNGGNLSWRVDSLRIFHDLGLSSLIFDYRGYGRSEGKPSVAGVALDARAAWEWLENRGVAPDDIVLFGRSLGGAVALSLTRHVKPRLLILESTFASPFGAVRLNFLAPLLRLAVGDIWNSREAARRLTMPTLCIHSPDDGIVPYREGRRLYEAVASDKTFVEIRGGHNEGFLKSQSVYIPALDAFLSEHLGRGPAQGQTVP
ncbi:MAG: alpha/beta hydrolase [Fretibacterium sp.]|nr:alpha/beta hydrolase [Fretibacterium sp.]